MTCGTCSLRSHTCRTNSSSATPLHRQENHLNLPRVNLIAVCLASIHFAGRIDSSKNHTTEEVEASLTGHYRPELMFVLRQDLMLYDTYQDQNKRYVTGNSKRYSRRWHQPKRRRNRTCQQPINANVKVETCPAYRFMSFYIVLPALTLPRLMRLDHTPRCQLYRG